MTSRQLIFLALFAACIALPVPAAALERIVVAGNGIDLVHAKSKRPFRPWGVNYGNRGRLMEDFWDDEWSTIENDFREIRQLGGNVVRVHLQFGRFMETAEVPNRKALQQLVRLVTLAESTGLYLDLTGLACYRPSDVPQWYDALDDTARWRAQANFWRAVAEQCANRTGVFCYDLMNEPIAPAGKTEKWYSGKLLGGYDFIQLIARDPGVRSRSETAIAWIKELSAAIREKDRTALVTVGMLPWVTNWKHLSGFVPKEIAPHVDFLSVHIYPKSKLPDEARTALKECVGQKPVVIEETFPLECSVDELTAFLRESRVIASGWIFHYDGSVPEEYDALERAGGITAAQRIWRDALRLFVELGAELTAVKD